MNYKAARRVPVPDWRYDYLCEYFKPLRFQNIDSRRPTESMELSVGSYWLSNAEFSPETAVCHFSRSCSFQWGIELAGRVGEVAAYLDRLSDALF
uniref:Uncharacterized protein n=1 Tax=Timema tahoe TaxID=61484 RepID=A0A7R9NWA1_9NEOP|nr:unnamed protein product [Timema tahoe]